MFADDDPFADFDTDEPVKSSSSTASGGDDTSGGSGGSSSSGGDTGASPRGNGNFAQELYTEKISAKFRTFFVDLKQSSNGKFVKISEKSRGGQKSTIMIDAEDLPTMIQALQNAQARC